jgi:hypothetical protein
VQFATFEKFQYLIRGERKIFANREDDFPIGGLHWETDSHSMLAQLVDGLHDVLGSLCEIGHSELSKRKRHHCGNGGARLVARTACAQVLHSFSTLLVPTIHAKLSSSITLHWITVRFLLFGQRRSQKVRAHFLLASTILTPLQAADALLRHTLCQQLRQRFK